MARYTGPKSRIARKFGEAIFGADKVLSKKNFPPGQHGNSRKRKTSEYGVQLREKQKAKYTYGILMLYWIKIYAICFKRLLQRSVLPVRYLFICLKVVWSMLFIVWVLLLHVLLLVSWLATSTLLLTVK